MVFLAILVVVGIAFASVIGEFHLRAGRSHRRRDRAADTLIALREMDGLEWRAIGGEDPAEIRARAREVSSALRLELEEVQHPTAGDVALAQSAVVYLLAVEDELTALVEGRTDDAAEIDETRVDPGFELAIGRAESVATSEAANADRTDRTMRRLTKGSSALAVIGGGIAVWLVESRRRQAVSRNQERQREQRFRSLVESSSDVITVVTGEAKVTQMSPNLGRLAEVVRTSRWEWVGALLGDGEVYERWLRADNDLQVGGVTQHLSCELSTAEGTRIHVDAVGTRLAEAPGERVWVWRDVSERRELELQLGHLAYHDALTGMANRSYFVERAQRSLHRAAVDGVPTSVLFCDLDDFKHVNDTFGHETGDELLGIVAERLRSCIRPRDTVGRIGGDEFVVLLEETDRDGAVAFARRVQRVLQAEVVLSGGVVRPSASIGVATARPGKTIEDLLRESDQAMYVVKGTGKGRAGVFGG